MAFSSRIVCWCARYWLLQVIHPVVRPFLPSRFTAISATFSARSQESTISSTISLPSYPRTSSLRATLLRLRDRRRLHFTDVRRAIGEFDDEADGFTLLEPNALADGRLRSARSLHVTGRASGAGGTRWGRA